VKRALLLYDSSIIKNSNNLCYGIEKQTERTLCIVSSKITARVNEIVCIEKLVTNLAKLD
jgi:hypothetical protein